jgi:CheY-like chemotaxis protein
MSAGSGRLLIVDDEKDFAAFIALVGREVGYTLRSVDRGQT